MSTSGLIDGLRYRYGVKASILPGKQESVLIPIPKDKSDFLLSIESHSS